MIDKEGTVLRNLEDQVQYLTDLNEWASLGFNIAGKMTTADTLPAADTLANGTTYIVGVKAPYHFWAAVNGGWVDLGEFPRKGDPGIKGEKGDSIVGPKGDPSTVPGPTGPAGKAGKNGDGLGVENITDINLATGAQSVTYDSTNGATVTAQGKIVAAGQDYPVTVEDKIPLVAGENVTIATENNKLKVNAKQAVKSVNGKVGNVELNIPTSTSQLVNDAEFITAGYHDPEKQNTLVSGDNIKTINNESILGPGNITISGGGGGGGTDTGFGNVSRIEYVDHSMGYYPDTKEYLVSSGRMGVYLNGSKDPINIETVQSFGIMPGNNITFTEELIDDEYKLKINATGGSSTDGFSNLKGLTLTPTTYQGADSPSGKFAFTGSGTYTLKDNSSGGIQELSFQLPVVPGDGIIFDKTTDGNCVIKAADYKPTITLETYTASQNTNHYGRVYYTFDVGNSTVATDIANGKYNVTIYDQTSGGGYYYCPLQGENMTFLGEEVPNDNNSGGPSSIVGWSFKAKESETVVSFWRDSLSLGGGGGGGGSSTYSVVEITSSTSTLTDEQYNTLIASPFNKIKLSNEIYDLYKETSAELTYTANYFNNGYQITINKSTKAVSTGSLSSLIAISAFVKNDLNYNQSNNRFALSAYQGKVLNDRLTAVENGGGSPIYQHTLTYNSDKFSDTDQFSGTEVQGSFSISFYSKHGHFESPSDFWTWLIDKGSIDVCDGQLWGSMGGGTSFTRITVLGATDAEKYISFESYGGYGEWSPINYFLKNPDATGLTDTITDGFRDM